MIPNRKIFLLFSSAILLAFFSGLLLNFQMLENEITRDIVQNASKIMGIEFQDAEIDSMLPELNEMVKTYETMREDSIGNEVAPALVFSPLPRGFEVEKTQRPISYEDVGIVDLPETWEIQSDVEFEVNSMIDIPAEYDQLIPFNFICNISNLKLLPGDYDVQISSKLISRFFSKLYS